MHAHVVRVALALGMFVAVGGVLAAPASAADGDELSNNDQIVMNGKLVVAQGETVDSAVLFHGTATIDGTVTRSVVVFDGPTEISGHVQQDVVVFNGPVTVRSGAQIDGDLVTSETPNVEPGATIGGQQKSVSTSFDAAGAVGVASRFVWWLGYSVSTLVLGLLALLFAPGLDIAIFRAVRERMGASIGFGALVFFLLPVVAVLLIVIVVALPLGVFLLLGLALLYTLGYVAGAHAIGRMLMKPPGSRYVAFLVGLGILRVLALIPFVGGLAWILATILGLGVLWIATRRAGEPIEAQALPPAPVQVD
jgi:hypothetical protein